MSTEGSGRGGSIEGEEEEVYRKRRRRGDLVAVNAVQNELLVSRKEVDGRKRDT